MQEQLTGGARVRVRGRGRGTIRVMVTVIGMVFDAKRVTIRNTTSLSPIALRFYSPIALQPYSPTAL